MCNWPVPSSATTSTQTSSVSSSSTNPFPTPPPAPTTSTTRRILQLLRYLHFLFTTYVSLLRLTLRSLPAVTKTLLASSLFLLLVGISVSTYGMFYTSIVHSGTKTVDYPVHFDYRFPSSSSSSSCTTLHDGLDQTCTSNNPSLVHTPPTARIELSAGRTQWTAAAAYRSTLAPAAPRPTLLKPDYPHFLHVALTLPSTEVNRDLGVFMVEVVLLHHTSSDPTPPPRTSWFKPKVKPKYDEDYDYGSSDDSEDEEDEEDDEREDEPQPSPPQPTVLATSHRSAMLPHESGAVGLVKTGLSLWPLVAGAWGEERVVAVESFDWFVESGVVPLTHVEIRLHTPPTYTNAHHPSHPPPHKPVQITRATLSVGRELNLLQRTLKNHFYKSAGAGVFFLSLVQAMAGWAVWFWWYHVRDGGTAEERRSTEGDEEREGLVLDEEDAAIERDADAANGMATPTPTAAPGAFFSIEELGEGGEEGSEAVPGGGGARPVSPIVATVVPDEDGAGKGGEERRKEEELEEEAKKVVRGEFGSYEIFTDLDEPEL